MEYPGLKAYLDAISETRQQKNLPQKERLKRLLTPIVALEAQLSPGNGIPHRHAQTDHIVLHNELDLNSLLRSDTWHFLPDPGLDQTGVLMVNRPVIEVNFRRFLPKSELVNQQRHEFELTSVGSLYRYWLPFLTAERMGSRDLLDQVLVCHTIKRAQAGDRQAVDKLVKLYIGRSESRETHVQVLRLLTSRLSNRKDSDQEISRIPQIDYDDDFRQTARILLSLIIQGFSPKVILDTITQEGTDNESFPIPRRVQDALLYYFGNYVPGVVDSWLQFIYAMHSYLQDPTEEDKLWEFARAGAYLLSHFSLSDNTQALSQIDYLKQHRHRLAPAEALAAGIIVVGILQKVPYAIAPRVSTMLSPYTPLADISLFAKTEVKVQMTDVLGYCYRPTNMGPRNNLTTWLFGGEGKSYNLGKLYQRLGDYYLKETRTQPEFLAFDGSMSTQEESFEREEARNDLKRITGKADVAEDDLKLLLDYYDDVTHDELADKHGITEAQVRYKLKKLLKRLQAVAEKK